MLQIRLFMGLGVKGVGRAGSRKAVELLLNYFLNQKMSVLTQKLQEASKLFQGHSFRKSLEAYQDCLEFCRKTDESQNTIFNILSTKAALEYILGDYDSALATVNSVLKKDSCHFLCLLRRSQIYKKKNKFKKALKDLETIYVFCPDNLQISALKVQIEHLLIKHQKDHESSSESQEQLHSDEQTELSFMNLRLIDRKSIDKTKMKERKSRVTILGDTTFEYRRDEEQNNTKDSEDVRDKAIRTYKEIEFDDEEEEKDSVPIIRINGPKRNNKSILKNKGTSIFIQAEDNESKKEKYLGRESKLLKLIRNIDGKLIPSAEHQHASNPEIKEVEFRKSINEDERVLEPQDENKSSVSSKTKRKSCLKRPSFQIPDLKNQSIRRSKFEAIDVNKIDGHVIVHKKRKSIDAVNTEGHSEQVDSDSDNDSSEHNIFGSKRYVLSQDLKQQLGISSGQDLDIKQPKENRKNGKKSILKKNSSILVPNKKVSQQETKQTSPFFCIRSKKSVMFNCTL